jgi:hypothetical protein
VTGPPLTLTIPPELVSALAEAVAIRLAEQLPAPSKPPLQESNGNGRLAVSKAEAAEMLGMSVDSFERHVLGELRTARPRGPNGEGRLRLIPVSELQNWLERHSARALGDEIR